MENIRNKNNSKYILVTGETLVDSKMFHLDKVEKSAQFSTHLGGSLFNVAVGLGKLNSGVFYLDVISKDVMGDLFIDAFKENNISLDLIERSLKPSALAWIIQREKKLEYRFYINGTSLVEINKKKAILKKIKTKGKIGIFHLGSFSSILNPKSNYYYALATTFKEKQKCLVSYDINARPLITSRTKEILGKVRRNLNLADVIKISDEDFEWVFKDKINSSKSTKDYQLIDSLVRKWAKKKEQHNKIILYTKGDRGAEIFWQKWSYEVGGINVKVVDTIGSGDTFMASILASLNKLDLDDEKNFRKIDKEILIRIVKRANLASAINCERSGANPPTQKEIEALEKITP